MQLEKTEFHCEKMAAVDPAFVRRTSSAIERPPSRVEPQMAAHVRIPLFHLSEQAKALCPRPSASTIEDLERILEKSVSSRKYEEFRGNAEERDDESVQELEVLTRRLGLLSMLCVKKRAALCRRMNIVRCRTYGLPLFREGETPREYYIVLHGCFQCIGRVYNGHSIPVEWTSEVRPGQDFYFEMGIGGNFGCISTAVPLLSRPSVSTAISDETQKLLNRFPIVSKQPRVKVCTLLSIDLDDLLAQIEPDTLHLAQISNKISELPIFASCSPRDFQAISPLFRILHPQQGEILFEQGSVLDRFYFVSSGSVEIMSVKSSDKSSMCFTVSSPGVFGEESVLVSEEEHAHAVFRAVCNAEQTELFWAPAGSIKERLHTEHIRYLENLHQTRLADTKQKTLNREQKLRSNHSTLTHSTLNINTTMGEEAAQNLKSEAEPVKHVMQSDNAFYKRFAPSDDSDAAKFKTFLRGSSPLFQISGRRSSQLPYNLSDFKDEDDDDVEGVNALPDRAPSVDLIDPRKNIHHFERSKSSQSAETIRMGSPKERPFDFGYAADMRFNKAKYEEHKVVEEWMTLLSKPFHGKFSLSNAPKAISRAKKEREGKFIPSESIPLLLETKNISYRTEMIHSKTDYIPNRANFELPAQLSNSFLGLYMPFNNKYIAHARKMAIKREEIEYNRLRRK